MTTLAALLLLAAPPAAPAAAETIEFDGETYIARFRSDQPNVRLIEYVREGETVENWTKLFAVRNYPQQTDPRKAVAVFAQTLKEHNPLARYQMLVKEDGSEAMIDFLTWAPGSSEMEFNAHRYFKLPGRPGLVSLQFAYRITDPKNTSAADLRALRTDALRELPPPDVFGK